MKIKELLKRWNNGEDGPRRYEFIIAAVLLFVAAFFFCFMKDFKLTMTQSLWFNTCLFNGKLHKFYSIINAEALAGHFPHPWPATLLSGANYSIINYATFGIACLPLYIIDRGFKLSLPLIWYELIIKTLYFAMTVYMAKIAYDICQLMGCEKNKSRWIALLFLTSPVLLFSSVIITHLDIFSVFFLMLGIRALFRENKKKELLFFMIAVAYKPFVILGIIPILLLKEKRILYIIRDMAVVVAGLLAQSAIYHFDPGYARTQKFMEDTYQFMNRFFLAGYTFEKNCYHGQVSFFVVGFILVCFLAYLVKNVKNSYLFAFPLMAWGVFSLFVFWHPNWMVLMVPFLVLCMADTHNFRLYCILEFIFTCFYFLVTAIGWENNYDNNMISGGVLSQLFGLKANDKFSIFRILRGKFASIPESLYGSVFAAALLCLMTLVVFDCYKTRKGISSANKENTWERGMIWLRVSPIVLFMLYSLATCLL